MYAMSDNHNASTCLHVDHLELQSHAVVIMYTVCGFVHWETVISQCDIWYSGFHNAMSHLIQWPGQSTPSVEHAGNRALEVSEPVKPNNPTQIVLNGCGRLSLALSRINW